MVDRLKSAPAKSRRFLMITNLTTELEEYKKEDVI